MPSTTLPAAAAGLPVVTRAAVADLIERERIRATIEDKIAELIDALDAIDATTEDLEDEDEHGGDILDEPHDEDTDREVDADAEIEDRVDGYTMAFAALFQTEDVEDAVRATKSRLCALQRRREMPGTVRGLKIVVSAE